MYILRGKKTKIYKEIHVKKPQAHKITTKWNTRERNQNVSILIIYANFLEVLFNVKTSVKAKTWHMKHDISV